MPTGTRGQSLAGNRLNEVRASFPAPHPAPGEAARKMLPIGYYSDVRESMPQYTPQAGGNGAKTPNFNNRVATSGGDKPRRTNGYLEDGYHNGKATSSSSAQSIEEDSLFNRAMKTDTYEPLTNSKANPKKGGK